MFNIDTKGSIIRAALALLDWSRADLAAASGVSIPTIARLQAGSDISEKNRRVIVGALERAGVRFIEGGVILREAATAAKSAREFPVERHDRLRHESVSMQDSLSATPLDRAGFLAAARVSGSRLDSLRHRDQLPFVDDGEDQGGGYTVRRAVELRTMQALAEEGLSLRDAATMVARVGPQIEAAIARHDASRGDDLWLIVFRLIGPDGDSASREIERREPIVSTLRGIADHETKWGFSVSELESGRLNGTLVGFVAADLSQAIREVLSALTASKGGGT